MSKIKRTVIVASFATLLALLLSVFTAALAFRGTQAEPEAIRQGALMSSEEVDIVVDANTPYTLIYSADAYLGDQELANSLKTLISVASSKFRPYPDTVAETEFEILIGNTNRAESKALLDKIEGAGVEEGSYVWGYAFINGKLVYASSSEIGFELGREEFLSLVASDGTLRVSSELSVINYMTAEEYAEKIRIEEEIKRAERLEELIEMNKAFADEPLLNTGYVSMIGEENAHYKDSPYAKPWVYPSNGQHPRFLITEAGVERIKEMQSDPEYKSLFYQLWRYAEADIEDGIFPERRGSSGEIYRYDTDILTGISARAMAYLITGDEYYAYEAIVAIKNACLTLKFTEDIHMDTYHGASHVIVVLASVYDWCYPVLTETDKWQLITAATRCLLPEMEIDYPPTKYNAVTGHGTGPQFLRDYMSLATAFYDEAPDWWEFVMGRYFEEYLPAVNLQYQNGWISQGTATYAPIKVMAQMWAAYLIKASTGENFLTEDGALGMQFFISHIMPSGSYFQTGDGERLPDGTAPTFTEYFIAAALYNDPTSLAWAKYISRDYNEHNKGSIFTMTPDLQLAFVSAVKGTQADKTEGLPLVQYFRDPAGQMTARDSWGTDAAAVLMKIGNVSMSDHDAYEHGTFQIYYKGLLAGTSGSYKEYGGDTHYYYLQATVAHNGLLVFNPSLAADAIKMGNNILNPHEYYYSGSQHRLPAPGTIAQWQDGSYRMAETMGADFGYNRDGSTKYAYIAGDITQAYDDVTVDYVGRRMLTVYTGNEEIPMVFLTFDEIASKEDYFEKTFLLHTIKEPEVDETSLTAVVKNGEGRLVLNSLFGADRIEKVGGADKAYWINDYYTADGTYVEGKNCLDEYTPDDNSQNIWGRVQLRASGEKSTDFLTAMYVTDINSEATLEITKYQNEYVYGASFDDSIAVFAIGQEKVYKAFSFETSGKGLYNYYISGVEDGTWNVKVDGVSVAYSLSFDGAGMLTFTAPAGKVELTPGKDVIGANGGKIEYLGGGILPDDAPYSYNNETETELPTNVKRGDDTFLGWFKDPSFSEESRIFFIPIGNEGTVTVYSKWRVVPTNETYSDNTGSSAVYVEGKTSVFDGVTYTTAKEGIVIATETAADGNTYLAVNHNGIRGQAVVRTTDLNQNISTFNESAVSFEISLSKAAGVDLPKVYWDFLTSESEGGAGSLSIGTVEPDGRVLLGGSKNIATVKEGTFTKIRLGVDFAKGTISAYDAEGTAYETITAKVPDGFDSLADWQKRGLKPHMLYLGIYNMNEADADGNIESSSLLIDDIKVAEGIIFGSDVGATPDGGIEYKTNGGTLPVGTPRMYDPELGTMLPANPERSGHLFAGWYTDPELSPESRVYYVPAGTEGVFRVYAKWFKLLADEDFTTGNIEVNGTSVMVEGVRFNGTKEGISLTTVTDGEDRYLKLLHEGVKGPAQISKSGVSVTEDTVSFEVSLSKLPGISLSGIRLEFSGSAVISLLKADSYSEAGGGYQFKLVNGTKPIATIKEGEFTTIRISFEYKTGRVIAYDADGNVIDSATGITKLESVTQFVFATYNLNSAGADGVIPDSAIIVDGLKASDGALWAEKPITELPPPTAIKYNTDGGRLPDDAPAAYDPESETPLPTDVSKLGYLFEGWYTDPAFSEESRIYSVPAGQKGVFSVYAKYFTAPTDEDYTGKEISVEGGNDTLGGITYSSAKAGIAMTTETDESGNTYLSVTHNGVRGQAVIRTTNNTYNISNFEESAVSFEISLSKLPNLDLSLVYWDIQTSPSSGGNGSMGLVTVNPDGSILLCGSKNIGTVTEGVFTDIKICIDFALGTVSAYDKEGNVIESLTPKAPTGFESLADWQRNGLKPHLLYLGIYNNNTQAEDGSIESSGILIDGVRVVDGRLW